MNEQDRYRYVCCIIGITLILALAAMCIGCRTVQYVPMETVRTDTCYVNRLRTDSVLIRDSIVVDRKGDTVYTDRWHWRERYTLRTDTLYRSRVDSVSVPCKVEAQLTKWQKCKQDIGGIAIGAAAALIILALILLIRRKRG